MITKHDLSRTQEMLVSKGPAATAHDMVSSWRFASTPMMDNSAPSAYTDRAPIAPDVTYEQMASVVIDVMRGLPDNPTGYAASNKAEIGLIALRVFDRGQPYTQQDLDKFSEIFARTTQTMVASNDQKLMWQPVCVPWMREILETNMDLMPVSDFKQFIHESSDFNRHYTGGNANYLDRRLFNLQPDMTVYPSLTMNQGLRAVVSNCFGLKRSDSLSLNEAIQSAFVPGIIRLAKVLNALKKTNVTFPAYQADLALTSELIVILGAGAKKCQYVSESLEIEEAIVSLVNMTMSPVKKVGAIRENRFRPGYTAKTIKFWMVSNAADALSTILGRMCSAMPTSFIDSDAHSAVERFKHQVAQNAFQALSNVIPYMDKADGIRGAATYFKLGLEVSVEGVPADVENAYLSKLSKADLADLVGSLQSKETRDRLMRLNPEIKGKVLMNDLGL